MCSYLPFISVFSDVQCLPHLICRVRGRSLALSTVKVKAVGSHLLARRFSARCLARALNPVSLYLMSHKEISSSPLFFGLTCFTIDTTLWDKPKLIFLAPTRAQEVTLSVQPCVHVSMIFRNSSLNLHAVFMLSLINLTIVFQQSHRNLLEISKQSLSSLSSVSHQSQLNNLLVNILSRIKWMKHWILAEIWCLDISS